MASPGNRRSASIVSAHFRSLLRAEQTDVAVMEHEGSSVVTAQITHTSWTPAERIQQLTNHQQQRYVHRQTHIHAVAPPGFCNSGEVRYVSIGGLEYEVPQSRLYCLRIYGRGSLLDGLAMYLSCDSKKFHDNESTHILHNFWTSTHTGKASPWRCHCIHVQPTTVCHYQPLHSHPHTASGRVSVWLSVSLTVLSNEIFGSMVNAQGEVTSQQSMVTNFTKW